MLYVCSAADYEFRVGDRQFSAGPGALVVVPRGSQHAFTTTTGGTVLFVCSPSGNEELFVELASLEPGAGPEVRDAVYARFETRGIDGPEGGPWRPE